MLLNDTFSEKNNSAEGKTEMPEKHRGYMGVNRVATPEKINAVDKIREIIYISL